MTKKHFKAIAEIIKSLRFDNKEYECDIIKADSLEDKLAEFFAKENSLFNKDRFETACK